MITDKIRFIWFPLFFILFVYEYFAPGLTMCGSMTVTGQMWFMWLMMSLSASGKYIELIENMMDNKK